MSDWSRRWRRLAEEPTASARLKARKALIAVEEELNLSQEKLDEDPTTIGAEELGRETQAAAEMLADVQSALELVRCRRQPKAREADEL